MAEKESGPSRHSSSIEADLATVAEAGGLDLPFEAAVVTDAHRPDVPASAARLPVSHRVLFMVISGAMFMSAIDLTIVSTALPTIHRSLDASLSWTAWTITVYALTTAIALPLAGRLSSNYGRRRTLVAGLVLFTVASLACGLAPNIYVLVAFRVVQALGGAVFQPCAVGIIAATFGDSRDRGIGLLATSNAAGQTIGPIIGGVFVSFVSWRWIFIVNVPIGVVLLALVLLVVPESRAASAHRMDWSGMAITSGLILALILALTNAGSAHAALVRPATLGPAVIGLVLAVAFVRHQRRTIGAFIPADLVRGGGLGAVNWINFFQGVVTFGVATLMPLYAEQRYHMRAVDAGGLLTARAVTAFALGAVAALYVRRTGYRAPLFFGYAAIASGWFMASFAPPGSISPFVWLSVAIGITGLGIGAINPATSNAGLHLVGDQVDALSGLRLTLINVGIILSVSVTTAVLNRSSNPGITQSHVLVVIAVLVVVVIVPLIFRVPERQSET